MRTILALFFAVSVNTFAQTPQVPDKLPFADLTLIIRDDARKLIQADVNALTAHPKSFQIKADRAQIYFPLIEQIFREENIPDDFKFLVLQESALIADAVSVSNAVGFWQFKDFTAIENGLQINHEVDERMNIVSATRAAARYLRKNNGLFNNWLYTLQSYQMGAGGVMKAEKSTQSGAKQVEISSATYWYVRKFLAHKIAFESAQPKEPAVKLVVLNTKTDQSLAALATELAIDEKELITWNKWVRKGIIPDDKAYPVVVPLYDGKTLPESLKAASVASTRTPVNQTLPASNKSTLAWRKKINGIQTLPAESGETPAKLAERAAVPLDQFLAWNDLQIDSRLITGEYYFLGPKRRRAETDYHTVRANEDLWLISQRYGVRLKRLKRFNRLAEGEKIQVGEVLWLTARKPTGDENPVTTTIVQLDESQSVWNSEPLVKTEVQSKVQAKAESEKPVKVAVQVEEVATPVLAPTDTVKVLESPQIPVKNKGEIPTTDRTNVHIVAAGETLYAIARKYQVPVMELVRTNNLDLQQPLKPGVELRLPEEQEVKAPVETKEVTSKEKTHEHIVKASDTVYSIARQYGVTIKELLDMNGKKDFTLAVGERLKVVQK